uniref:Uncharacterized protein n=1 Tax=Molossus molossus TaxID=27622 RepID=A0A7J8E3Q0_MOLMO|nr:hypothetical protein HJG59_009088 [Molossus molossus]
MEISNLSDIEFRVINIRMLNSIKIDIENIKNNHLEMKNDIAEIKITLERIKSRLEKAKDQIIELEDKVKTDHSIREPERKNNNRRMVYERCWDTENVMISTSQEYQKDKKMGKGWRIYLKK